MRVNRLIITVGLFLMAIVFVGCGGSGEKPEQAVTNALNAIKNSDQETAQKYLSYEDLFGNGLEEGVEEVMEYEEILKLMAEKLSFKILSSTEEGDTATVKTEIVNIDMRQVFGEYFRQVVDLAFASALSSAGISEEEMGKQAEQILVDLLKKEDNKMLTSTIDIKLTKSETGWRIEANETFQDAVFGGMVSAMKDLSGDSVEE